jgi:hypothetical protein
MVVAAAGVPVAFAETAHFGFDPLNVRLLSACAGAADAIVSPITVAVVSRIAAARRPNLGESVVMSHP